MDNTFDYDDIQGNIMVNYPEYGYIKARYLFFKVTNVDHGQDFVKKIEPLITPSSLFTKGPDFFPAATTNISFSYNGLKRLGIPVLTLQSFPDEFIVGLRGRRSILGDNGKSDAKYWDPVWHKEIHIFISIDARNQADLEQRYQKIIELTQGLSGVELLDGHKSPNGGPPLKYQEASALFDKNGLPTPKEHFGYSDGISNPYFKGMTEEMGSVLGGGKKVGYEGPESPSNWEPIETGEFILGYKDEAQEYPLAPTPPLMGRNGSFIVYNKFHENVGSFNRYLEEEGKIFPGGKELLAAKFVGRWRNGAPLTTFPDEAKADEIAIKRQQAVLAMTTANTTNEKKIARLAFYEINKKFVAFDYDEDLDGSRCPVGAHIRRSNPRGSLEFGNKKAFASPSALDNRRRLIRRGLPYGISDDSTKDDGEHGTIIMTVVASIKRQFEFVIQQWLQYGNDFKLANDKDPITGNHAIENGVGTGRMIIEGFKGKNPPYFLNNLPRFIETRGGEYFFMPSLTALRMIGEGIVDPT